MDIVFDQYFQDSLKSATREKRGSGVHYKVEAKNKLPGKWKDFLLVDENKAELFHFLALETSQHKFKDFEDFHLWILFGTRNSTQMIHVNTVCAALGKKVSRGIPFFHALTGCDTTSAFKGKGKKSAWQTWKGLPAITPVFEHLSQNPFEEIEQASTKFKKLQKFVVHMYSKNVEASTVNEGRKLIFANNKNMEKIPPTEDALLQHIKRAIHQTGEMIR